MSYSIQVQETLPLLTAVIRCRARPSELAHVVPACCGEVWEFAKAARLPHPGRHVALYLDGAITLECGVEVTAPFAGNHRVRQSATPSGLAATACHVGAYSGLGDAHRAIRQWCEDQGYALAGPNWEVYGHWVDAPSQPRTDVYYLVAAPPRPAT